LINLIVDENVHQGIIDLLINRGYHVVSIKSVQPGITDQEIIEKYLDKNSVLITEDSDFGKWVFVHQKKVGVIYLRYHYKDVEKIGNRLIGVLHKYEDKLTDHFIVLTPKKIRIRGLK